jgi:hypothetical protein
MIYMILYQVSAKVSVKVSAKVKDKEVYMIKYFAKGRVLTQTELVPSLVLRMQTHQP